jgi:hypothetical protein
LRRSPPGREGFFILESNGPRKGRGERIKSAS